MRAVVKLKDGTHINIEANYIQYNEEFVSVWKDDCCVAVVRVEFLNVAYLSERIIKNERN